jgi:hypothetical protein
VRRERAGEEGNEKPDGEFHGLASDLGNVRWVGWGSRKKCGKEEGTQRNRSWEGEGAESVCGGGIWRGEGGVDGGIFECGEGARADANAVDWGSVNSRDLVPVVSQP